MIDTTASAFFAGMVTSLHCVGMCGPMACSWVGTAPNTAGFLRNTGLYHAARLLSYTSIGAAAGALGIMPLRRFQHGPGALLPWLMVGLFVIVAFGLERRIPKPKFLSLPMARLKLWAMRQSGSIRGIALGLATPLLPCGPLYLMFGLAMVNGSAEKGAEFAGAFGLGTLPLLWLAQTQLQILNTRLSPVQMRHLQRALALCAAAVMVWRLRGTLTGEMDATCCH